MATRIDLSLASYPFFYTRSCKLSDVEERIKGRVVAVAIDEAHSVSKW